VADLRVKAWLEVDGRYVLGRGTAKLLQYVHEEGSIAKAARRMGMSYRHAWGLLREIQEGFGRRVVATRRGGPSGGGARLTEAGRELLREFQHKNGALQTYVDGGMRIPFLAADGVLLLDGRVVLVRRRYPPFEGMYALPGGMVEHGERLTDAVVREMREETGLDTEPERLLGVYSDPDRDPRGHTVSVVYVMRVVGGELRAGSDAREVATFPLDDLPELAFDHARILEDYASSQ
jgi:8-oxo-dGTP diphosphatase